LLLILVVDINSDARAVCFPLRTVAFRGQGGSWITREKRSVFPKR